MVEKPALKITNELISAAVRCDHKINHHLNGATSTDKELLRIQMTIAGIQRSRSLQFLKRKYAILDGRSAHTLSDLKILKKGICITDFTANSDMLKICFEAVFIKKNTHNQFSIEPIFFSFRRKLGTTERQEIIIQSLLLREIPGFHIKTAKIFLLNHSTPISLKISEKASDIKVIKKLKSLAGSNDQKTHAKVISYCRECPYEEVCLRELQERDDLSLLSGLSKNEIKMNQAKGIFTINQLSHTYRPRRRPVDVKQKFYASLKAMAIREGKIYITEPPIVPTNQADIFLDVEGIPESSFYLIGVHVRTGRRTKIFSFWADNEDDERKIWMEFLKLLKGFKNYNIFHYGNYEKLFFAKMRQKYRLPPAESETFEQALSRLVNVVSLNYGRVYFPTYSNGLKDIGKYLGFNWSNQDATGALSVEWRTKWELIGTPKLREDLIEYNSNDCAALYHLVNFLRRISNPNIPASIEGKLIARTDEIRQRSNYKWGNTAFLVPELDKINKCAYFDYQLTKIYFGKRSKKKRAAIKKLKGKRLFKVNKIVTIAAAEKCPKCCSMTYRHGKGYWKVVRDLKFSDGGVKRWIVQFRGLRRRCPTCKYCYVSQKYINQGQGYGNNLIAFVGYLNIALRMSFGEIREYFRRVFGMDIPSQTLSGMKQRLAAHYEQTVKTLLKEMRAGPLLQVDETTSKIDGKGCYVWTFATLSEVVFLYAPTRKGDILHTQLKGFKGVLVSDFFAAYDSVPCAQQKCLVHLIRDLNDDLFKNQLNEEFKIFVQNFANLMKLIIETIDKWGLRAKYLFKHQKDVRRYFQKLKRGNFQTEISQQYQKRFLRNETRLFTFLKYDNVPWNNNYAENAIKTFAEFRRKFNPHFQSNGLKEYLTLLSIQHPCKLRQIDFLQFLLSRRKSFPNDNLVS